MATRVINIWATVCAVEIHAPSSNPACTAPRMSARPRLDSRVLRVDMNVPINTAVKPSHGNDVGGAAAAGRWGAAVAGAGNWGAAVVGAGTLMNAHLTSCP